MAQTGGTPLHALCENTSLTLEMLWRALEIDLEALQLMEGVRLRAARRHLFYFPLLGRLCTEFAPGASLSRRPRG